MMQVTERLEELYPEMIELRRHFHQHPELSFNEVHTPVKIAEYLTSLGIEVRTGVGGRGVVGYIRGNKPGRTVALRADFDALPIQDEKDVPYKSTVPGVMHACGHDAHTAALMTVAKALSERKEDLEGTVVLIHQFAEELTPGGALPMIEDGCLEGVEAIFGTHIWAPLPIGTVGYRSGPLMAAADQFEIIIEGKGGHGASPHETVDPIIVATSVVQALQHVVSRRIDPLKPAVLTIGSFHAGHAFNVISNEAKLTGTVRTFETIVQDEIIRHMEDIIATTCAGAGASYRFSYSKGYPAVVNHHEETKFITEIASSIIGEEHLKEVDPIMGGEDFARYLEKVPGTFFFTGGGNPEKECIYPHHHPKFDIDERSMLISAKVLATAAITYLGK